MGLTRLARKPRVKLHRSTEAPIMVEGWEITSFYDDDDEWYERAQRRRNGRLQTRWWRLE